MMSMASRAGQSARKTLPAESCMAEGYQEVPIGSVASFCMSTPHTKTYVLVHGAWHSGRVWDRVVPLLTRAGHQVFAPSLTGHGEKEHLLTPGVDLDTHVADVVALLTEGDLTNVVLVGHSY